MPQAVLAIIRNEKGEVLVGELKEEKRESFGRIQYVFPGGKVEEGEGPEEAVVREVKEETGLAVKVIELIASRIHPVTNKSMSYYRCEIISEKINEIDGELARIIWVPIVELKSYMPTLYNKISEYLKL